MKYLAEFIVVIPVNVAMAWWHARLIKEGRPILHGLWGLLYAVLIGIAIWLLWPAVSLLHSVVAFALACACARLPVFSIILNCLRGERWYYVPVKPKSILDRFSKWLFGIHAWILWFISGGAAIILTFYI
jgi:hypothetical protein